LTAASDSSQLAERSCDMVEDHAAMIESNAGPDLPSSGLEALPAT
jgi:hypothetical protein